MFELWIQLRREGFTKSSLTGKNFDTKVIIVHPVHEKRTGPGSGGMDEWGFVTGGFFDIGMCN
jgi:hypothetical protein